MVAGLFAGNLQAEYAGVEAPDALQVVKVEFYSYKFWLRREILTPVGFYAQVGV